VKKICVDLEVSWDRVEVLEWIGAAVRSQRPHRGGGPIAPLNPETFSVLQILACALSLATRSKRICGPVMITSIDPPSDDWLIESLS
jgi:hypothetical protein